MWSTKISTGAARFYDAALAGFSTTDKIHMIHYLDKLLSNMRQLDADDLDL